MILKSVNPWVTTAAQRIQPLCKDGIPCENVVQVQDVPLSIYLPANAPGKTIDDGLSTWDPAFHVGDSDRVPGSLVSAQPSPGHCNHCGSDSVDGSLLSFSLCSHPFVFPSSANSLSNKQINHAREKPESKCSVSNTNSILQGGSKQW